MATSNLAKWIGSTRMKHDAELVIESLVGDATGALGPLTRIERETGLAMEPLAKIRDQRRLALSPFVVAPPKALSGFARQLVGFNRPLIGSALLPPIPKIRLSSEWQQLWDDIDAADGFAQTNEILSEHEKQTPMRVFAEELAVPALAERIRRLSNIWSIPTLADAACQLEEEDARWRTAEDERAFASIIHRTVSVLEEVAWQVAYSHLDHNQSPGVRRAPLRSALRELKRRGAITRSQQERMMQASDLRNKTPGAGHRVGRAPREAAGFVLFRARQGLRDILDGVDHGAEM